MNINLYDTSKHRSFRMTLNPMEWESVITPRYRSLLCFALLICITALPLQAAVLRLNPGDNAKNVIEFDGAIEATIIQSAAGMDIIIPGVTFTLDCQGVPAESCNLSVASASPSQPSAGSGDSSSTDSSGGTGGDTVGGSTGGTSGGSTGDNTGGASSTTGDNCDGKTGFGAYNCEDGAATSGGDTAGGSSSGSDDGWSVDTGDSTDSGGDSDDGWGTLTPSTDTGSGSTPTREAFPASGRIDYKASPDVGSASSIAAKTNYVTLAVKTVTVLPFTMSGTPVSGGVSYADTTRGPKGTDLGIWVSKVQDGDALPGCSKYGGIDGQLKVSTQQGASGCALEPGAQYFLNLAPCVRTQSSDYACRANALTGYTGGEIILVGRW